MVSILKDIGLTLLVIFLNHWIYGIEDAIAYEFIVDFIARKQALFLGLGILGSGALLISAAMFESLGLYKITYGLCRVLARISQFLIIFLAIINMAFCITMRNNLLRDNGYLALFLLVLILGASCWSLRIIDFNFPVRSSMAPAISLAVISVIVVEVIWPFMNF